MEKIARLASLRKIMDSKFLKGFSFAIDRGGTFTDVFAKTPTGKSFVMKLLSEDPANYPDAPREGIRRILEKVCGKQLDNLYNQIINQICFCSNNH